MLRGYRRIVEDNCQLPRSLVRACLLCLCHQMERKGAAIIDGQVMRVVVVIEV